MAKTFFFGYGSYRDKKKIAEIIGKDPEGGEPAVLEGYLLAVQTLDQIPGSARAVLQKVWGDQFRAYTIRKSPGIVVGTVWIIDQEDLNKIKEWEFVEEQWREIKQVDVTTNSGTKIPVLTDLARETLPVKEFVNGIEYEYNLNKKGKKIYREDDEHKFKEIMRIRQELGITHQYLNA